MARRERAKKEKERKKKRAEEARLRTEAIKSRNALYAMIKSDEITQFFNDRAENPALANEELPWLKPAPEQLEDESVMSGVTHNFDGTASLEGSNPRYEYDGEFPNTGGIHPSAASVESMSIISNVSDFGIKNYGDAGSVDNMSQLDSIAEYQNFDDGTAVSLDTHGSPKKKGIFGWLFRGRKS